MIRNINRIKWCLKAQEDQQMAYRTVGQRHCHYFEVVYELVAAKCGNANVDCKIFGCLRSINFCIQQIK